MESTDRSLKNLGLETIDVQQLHVWNPEWIARDEWKRAFEELGIWDLIDKGWSFSPYSTCYSFCLT